MISAALAGTALVGAAGCSADGEDSGDSNNKVAIKRALQRPLTEKDWQAIIVDNPALGALANAVGSPFQAAGVIEGGDGRRLQWAEYAASPAAQRKDVVGLYRHCDSKGTCQVGKTTHSATSASAVDDAGKGVAAFALGEVVLHKTLKNHNLEKSETVLRLGLKRNHIIKPALASSDTAKITQGQRRLVVLSAYGKLVGLPLQNLLATVKKAGIFDVVTMIEFARRRDLQGLLPTMTPQDVLVWVGAGVLEPFSDNVSKSIGMTLSRGVFGDELIHRNHVDKLLEAPVLGGPGLILLVGSNSLTSDHESQTGLMAEHLHQATYRPVVGFDGKLTAKTAEAGAVALLQALFGGETLSAAMATASKAAKATATTMLTDDQAKVWTLPVAKDKFWSTPPKSATLKLYMKNSPKCVVLPAGGACTEQGFKLGAAVPSEKLTAAHVVFSCDLQVDGPWLSCDAKVLATGADFKLRGVMTGQKEGDHILLTATGAPSKKMKGVTLIGAGRIEKSTDANGTLTVSFGGEAAGSTWIDADGNCCIAVTPLLTGNQSQRSVLIVKR